MGERERRMDAVSHAPPQPPPQPPPPSTEIPIGSRIQRYKLIWRVFIIANLGLGAYIFAKAKMKDPSVKRENLPIKDPPQPNPSTSAPSTSSKVDFFEESNFLPSTPIADLVKVREPIAEDQQREIFQWLLDEKRKMKPSNKDEKKRVDEDKAVLKKFIRAESIPPV